MGYLPHQIKKGKEALTLLRKLGYAYIQGEPRSGKTATALWVADNSKIDEWLIITKKKAISGWEKFINPSHPEFIDLGLSTKFDIVNYESVHKIDKTYKGVILDESHRLKGLGKPPATYKRVNKLISRANAVHLHLSGTPVVETPAHIYYQMQLGYWKPFKEKNFYKWFEKWGKPYSIMLQGRLVKQYDKVKPELLDEINKFVITLTQEEAGISKDIQAKDEIHYVELTKEQKRMIEEAKRDKVIKLPNGHIAVLESIMAERLAIHQIEGGTLKYITIEGREYFIAFMPNPKIEYIEKNLLVGKVGIMAHFKGEQSLLETYFKDNKNVEIYSSNAHKEGVDLSHLDTFIIYSQDYSGEGFIQRRDRIVNINKKGESVVHHLLVKGGLSEYIYNIIKNKEKFNNETYLMWRD